MARRKAKSASNAVDATEFSDHVKKSGLASAYLIIGDEDYLRRQVLQSIRRKAFDGELDSPSLAEFRGDQSKLSNILDEARTLPFLGGGHRVVIVDKAENLLASPSESWSDKRKKEREDEIKALMHYLKNPVDSSTLVLIFQSLDKRRKTSKEILKCCPVIECETPDVRRLTRWVESLASNPPFAPGAADALIERCAHGAISLGQLASEVEKLEALAQGQAKIGRDLVETLVDRSSADGFFDLLRPINAGRSGEALEMVASMLKDGAVGRDGQRIRDPSTLTILAIGAFAWDLRTLWKAWALVQSGTNRRSARSELKTPRAEDFIRRARRISLTGLKARHEALRQADLRIRSFVPPVQNFTELVLKLSEQARKER